MANETRSFRSAVLGFDRSDVINYIELMSKERGDEVEAHRRAADVLRRERDEAKETINQLNEQIKQMKSDSVEVARQNEELFAKRILCTELSERLSKVNSELAEAREQINSQAQTLKRYEEENHIIGVAKTRAADMELMAYKRAEAIEAETMRNTEKARSMLKRLMSDTKGKYAMARSEAETVAYNALKELNKLTEWVSEFPRLFDGVDDKFETMNVYEKPQVRAFVPRRFDEDGSTQEAAAEPVAAADEE